MDCENNCILVNIEVTLYQWEYLNKFYYNRTNSKQMVEHLEDHLLSDQYTMKRYKNYNDWRELESVEVEFTCKACLESLCVLLGADCIQSYSTWYDYPTNLRVDLIG